MTNTNAWIDLMAVGDIFEGEAIAVDLNNQSFAVYSVEGQIYVTDNICTHGNARLCDGFLEGHEIECPFHQGRFDIRDGQPTCLPVTEALRTYRNKVENGRLLVSV